MTTISTSSAAAPSSATGPTTCIETGLPTQPALRATLNRRPRPFHLVVVRLERGTPLDAAVHLTTILRGQGALYRLDERHFAVLLPTSLVRGGQLFIEALGSVPGPSLILSAATGSWLGGCDPLETLRDVHSELTWGQRPPRPPAPVTADRRAAAQAPPDDSDLLVVSLADELYG